MKRSIIMCLIVFMALPLMVFAGGESEASEGKVQVRFQDWHMTEDVWLKCLEETKAMFEEQHPDIEIVFESVSHQNKGTKFTVGAEAGNSPDVVHVEMQDIAPFIKKGYLLNLNSLIAKEGGDDWLEQWADLSVDYCKDDGIMYAMPDTNQSIVLFYNTHLFKKAGLDPNQPPKTWKEFVEYSEKLSDTNSQWGFGMVANKSASLISRFLPILWSFGGDIFNDDMTASALDTRESIEGFKFYIDLVTKYKITPPGPNEMSAQDVRTFLAQEKAAMNFGSGWTISIVDAINPDLNAYDVLANAPLPVGKEQATFSQMDFWGISADTKVKEAAWEWVKFLTSESVQLKFWQDNGVTSARLDVGSADQIVNDKFSKTIVEQIPYGRPMPKFIGMTEVNDVIITAAQEAMTGQKDPETAIRDAAKAVNAIIAKYNQ